MVLAKPDFLLTSFTVASILGVVKYKLDKDPLRMKKERERRSQA